MKNIDERIKLNKARIKALKKMGAPEKIIATEEELLKQLEALALAAGVHHVEVKVVTISLEDFMGMMMQAAIERGEAEAEEERKKAHLN